MRIDFENGLAIPKGKTYKDFPCKCGKSLYKVKNDKWLRDGLKRDEKDDEFLFCPYCRTTYIVIRKGKRVRRRRIIKYGSF